MNWTISDLAQLADVDPRTLEWFEQGKIDGEYIRGRIQDALDLGRRPPVPDHEILSKAMERISGRNDPPSDGRELGEELSAMVASVLIWFPIVMLSFVVVGSGMSYAVMAAPFLAIPFLLGLWLSNWSGRRSRVQFADRRSCCEIVLTGIRSGNVPVVGRMVADGIERTMGRSSLADARAASRVEVRIVDDPVADRFWARLGRRDIQGGESSSDGDFAGRR